MVLPIDDPPDLLYGLIVHELTHQFEFDIIPQGAHPPQRAAVGQRRAVRLRARAVEPARPDDGARRRGRRHRPEDERDSRATATSSNPRLVYNLGHAVFEFIEAKFGKEGIRQFLFALRKSVIGGGEDAYEEALRMKKDEFDQAFERYLKERFKPFRDKERPADYGRDLVAEQGEDALSPRRCRSRRRRRATSSPPSPSTARTASSTSS